MLIRRSSYTQSGNYEIDLLLANVCKQNVTRFPYDITRLAEDIAGGLMVTMPSEKDFKSDVKVGRNGETIGEICNKFFAAGLLSCTTEERMRILRFIENICLGIFSCRIQNRITARRWFPTGSENHDRKTGKSRRQERIS